MLFFNQPVRKNQADHALKSKVAPGPVDKDQQAVSIADKQRDVYQQSGQPRRKASICSIGNVGHGCVAANHGHRLFVLVGK
jgi:hypothetical protein